MTDFAVCLFTHAPHPGVVSSVRNMLERFCSNFIGLLLQTPSSTSSDRIHQNQFGTKTRLTFRCVCVCVCVIGNVDMSGICRNNVRKLRHLRLLDGTASHCCSVTTISVSVAYISCFYKFFIFLDRTYNAFRLRCATKISVDEKKSYSIEHFIRKSQDSSVGTAVGYEEIGSRFPTVATDFSTTSSRPAQGPTQPHILGRDSK
jgi:hypothetical protein